MQYEKAKLQSLPVSGIEGLVIKLKENGVTIPDSKGNTLLFGCAHKPR
jgi:hypothetical protein